MNNDSKFSPWPIPGRSIEFRFRRAVWCSVRPWYGLLNPLSVRRMFMAEAPLPFLTVNNRLFHLYIGWKPITLDDPKFYWRDLFPVAEARRAGKQFVQLSARWGLGNIS